MIHPISISRREQLLAIGLARTGRQQLAIDPINDRVSLCIARLLILVRRRHVSSLQLLENLKPQLRGLGIGEIKRRLVKSQLALLLLLSMTTNAVGLEKAADCGIRFNAERIDPAGKTQGED